jgi:hypothetical protein
MNLDETPIPFEYNSGYSYDTKGVRSVLAKSDRSGWDKRQATLILYIFADGIHRLKPKIIFHGASGPAGKIYQQEEHLYSPDVTVEFNPTAYNNEELFSKWIDKELAPLAKTELLLVMDVASFHVTEGIKKQLKDLGALLALIPAGCTSLLQPLDTAINAPFKLWLEEFTDEYITKKEKEKPDMKWTVSERRIMTTWVVAKAIRRLEEHLEIVQRAFIHTGISIRPDGSQTSLIRIKGIEPSQIDFQGWETIEEPTIKTEPYEEEPVTLLEEANQFITADEAIEDCIIVAG